MNRQKYYQNRIGIIIAKGIKEKMRPSQILESLLQDRDNYTELELAMFKPFKNSKGIGAKKFSTYSEEWACK